MEGRQGAHEKGAKNTESNLKKGQGRSQGGGGRASQEGGGRHREEEGVTAKDASGD